VNVVVEHPHSKSSAAAQRYRCLGLTRFGAMLRDQPVVR